MTTPRGRRADAVRNREKILETARAQITEHGPEVGMVEIAKAAGVAVGTLYRHFPTKTDLVAAVVMEHIGRLADAAEHAWDRVESGRSDAGEEVLAFVGRVLEASAGDQAVKAAARALGAELEYSEDEARATQALARLVEAGSETGLLRSDLTVNDIYLLATTGPVEHPVEVRERWLTLVQPGLLRAAENLKLPGSRQDIADGSGRHGGEAPGPYQPASPERAP
ncbi:hypothetical protein GCM10022225_71630 [Plantactinospora mayteni]|uniref:HTH tetR-type domain-containing protein n=1 Tax=Plantactinospora mayteni TaxID=566021 RepID=A0ABQ4F140_9ACTN|nr:TetR/AcrR family transcriptional regulator [Plantactinospora mayteni]GIH00616.1 hypothetical protein Pma05_71880 [Plantactinospora mayteni]